MGRRWVLASLLGQVLLAACGDSEPGGAGGSGATGSGGGASSATTTAGGTTTSVGGEGGQGEGGQGEGAGGADGSGDGGEGGQGEAGAGGAGSATLNLSFTLHLEGQQIGSSAQQFQSYVTRLRTYAELFERHGARLTLESDEMTEAIETYGDDVLAELEARGHAVGAHVSLDRLDGEAEGTSFMQEEKAQLEALGVAVVHASGVCADFDWVGAVSGAGFDFVSSVVGYCLKSLPLADQPQAIQACDNPSQCHDPYPDAFLDRLHPWRVSADDWTTSDDEGPLVIIPTGSSMTCMQELADFPGSSPTECPFDQGDLDVHAELLATALGARDPDRVNTFGLVWSGIGPDLELLEQLLTATDAAVASGEARYATLPQVHAEFVGWEASR